MTKKKEKVETLVEPIDSLWALMIVALLFGLKDKPSKVINIYVGDEE